MGKAISFEHETLMSAAQAARDELRRLVVDSDLKTAAEKLEQYQRAQQQPKLKRVK